MNSKTIVLTCYYDLDATRRRYPDNRPIFPGTPCTVAIDTTALSTEYREILQHCTDDRGRFWPLTYRCQIPWPNFDGVCEALTTTRDAIQLYAHGGSHTDYHQLLTKLLGFKSVESVEPQQSAATASDIALEKVSKPAGVKGAGAAVVTGVDWGAGAVVAKPYTPEQLEKLCKRTSELASDDPVKIAKQRMEEDREIAQAQEEISKQIAAAPSKQIVRYDCGAPAPVPAYDAKVGRAVLRMVRSVLYILQVRSKSGANTLESALHELDHLATHVPHAIREIRETLVAVGPDNPAAFVTQCIEEYDAQEARRHAPMLRMLKRLRDARQGLDKAAEQESATPPKTVIRTSRGVGKSTDLAMTMVADLGKFAPPAPATFAECAIDRVRHALRQAAAGNRDCTMTDLGFAAQMLDELIRIKFPGAKAPKPAALLDLTCRVDVQEMVRRGFGNVRFKDGLCRVTINLAELSEEDRQLLASCVNDQMEFRPGNLHERIPEPTPKGLVEALQAVRAWRTKQEEEAARQAARSAMEAQRDFEQRTTATANRDVWAYDEDGTVIYDERRRAGQPGGYSTYEVVCPYSTAKKEFAALLETDEGRQWQTELDAKNEVARIEAYARAKHTLGQRLEEEKERQQQLKSLLDWAVQYGSSKLRAYVQEDLDWETLARQEWTDCRLDLLGKPVDHTDCHAVGACVGPEEHELQALVATRNMLQTLNLQAEVALQTCAYSDPTTGGSWEDVEVEVLVTAPLSDGNYRYYATK